MTRSRTFVALVCLVALLALASRLVGLGERPMHGDEAVHAAKFQILWETGTYTYDPHEFHGPTLYYCALPIAWLSGVGDFSETGEATFRLVPVLFGVGLILLLLLVVDGLGRTAVICTAVLTAVSPAMVFYSRYYIQETLLVFFTFAAIAFGWRYVRSRRAGWALAAGAALGLMHATKETCIIAYGALAAALAVATVCHGSVSRAGAADEKHGSQSRGTRLDKVCGTRRDEVCGTGFQPVVLAGALAVAVAVSVTLMSGFFTNLSGPFDSVRTYLTYFSRAGGADTHVHPWNFYLRRLVLFHDAPGPWWSEGVILLLAAIGVVVGVARGWRGAPPSRRSTAGGAPAVTGASAVGDVSGRATGPAAGGAPAVTGDAVADDHNAGGCGGLVRFLVIYTVLLTLAYTLIPYKTPWSMLGFLHGMILLAGVGAAWVWEVLRRPVPRLLAIGVLVVAVGHLGWQAWQANTRFATDTRNPYVYSHPLRSAVLLGEWVERLAAAHPDNGDMLVQVISENPWPLPWYLRRLGRVGYWERVPEMLDAPVIVADDGVREELERRLAERYVFGQSYALRPGERLAVYVDQATWDRFVEREGQRQ